MRPVAPGVWLLNGRIPYLINVYLLESPEGDILVDGGTRWTTKLIVRQLRNRKLTQVALTHCHPDHQGAVAAVCRSFHVPLACHELDAPVMEGQAPFLPRTLPVRLFSPLLAGPAHPVSQRWQGGENLGEFRVIPTPGHTPGHVLFFRERDRLALAGDVLRNIIFPFEPGGVREPPHLFSANPLENRRSIRRLLDLQPSLVLFGHGQPCADLSSMEKYAVRLGV